MARCEYSCAYLLPICAHEAAGASGARHSPRPLFSGRRLIANLGRIPPRECGGVSADCCLKIESVRAAYSMSSLRTQGPITTGGSGCVKVLEQRFLKQTTRRMGPRVRGDDSFSGAAANEAV